MQVVQSIHELIGSTPLLELTTFTLPNQTKIFAKLEFYNPGGSVKDRLGMALLENAIKTGKLIKGGTVIEPTAGNTGIGLGLAALKYHVNALFVVPEKFSVEKQALMKALGAKIVYTPTADGMKGAIKKANELALDIPNSYLPEQFQNVANPNAYYHTLGPELIKQLDGKIDVFVAGAGTGGTFTGVARYLKEQLKQVKTVVVEPEGSILNGGQAASHDTEGIGLEFIPNFMDPSLFDDIHTVQDTAAFRLVKELAQKEGLFVGSSSGAAMYASLLEAQKAKPGSTIVTIFPDSSERYLSKHIYAYETESERLN